MGLKLPYINLIKEHTLQNFSTLNGIKILELGNQVVRPNQGVFEKTGKEYWTNQGMIHTSVDLNGRDGALVKDLTVIEDFTEFTNHFDVVYNLGTTEHVEPYADQYTAFQIIDMCCKPEGIMIHGVPEVTNLDERGIFATHCHYYYSEQFFKTLAEECDYQLLHLKINPTNIGCVLKKTAASHFKITKDRLLADIAVRNKSSDFSRSPDYEFQRKKAKF